MCVMRCCCTHLMPQNLPDSVSLPAKPPSSHSPPPPSCERLSTLHPEEGVSRGAGCYACLGPQAVPGPLVLPKQGHTVSSHTGYRCARGRPEHCVACANCSWAAKPHSQSVRGIRHSPPHAAASCRAVPGRPMQNLCVCSHTGSRGPPVGHLRNNSLEVPRALTYSLQSS